MDQLCWAAALFLLFYAIFFGSGIKNFGFVFLVPLLFLIFRRCCIMRTVLPSTIQEPHLESGAERTFDPRG